MFLNAGEALEAEKKDLRGLIERHIYLLEWVQMRSPQSVVVFTVFLVVWSVGPAQVPVNFQSRAEEASYRKGLQKTGV